MSSQDSSEISGLFPPFIWEVYAPINRRLAVTFTGTWAKWVQPNPNITHGLSLRRPIPTGDALELSGVFVEGGSSGKTQCIPLTNHRGVSIGLLRLIPIVGSVSPSWISDRVGSRAPLIDEAGIRYQRVVRVDQGQELAWQLSAPKTTSWSITGLPANGPVLDDAGCIRGAFDVPGRYSLLIYSAQQTLAGCPGQVDVIVDQTTKTPASIRAWIHEHQRPFEQEDFNDEFHNAAELVDVIPGTMQQISELDWNERQQAEETALQLVHIKWRSRFGWQPWPCSSVMLESPEYLKGILSPRPARQGRRLLNAQNYEMLVRDLFQAAIGGPHSTGRSRRARLAREMQGWSLADVGKHLGCKKNQVGGWESLTEPKSIPAKYKTPHAATLGVDPTWIETGDAAVDPTWLMPYRTVISNLRLARAWAMRAGIPVTYDAAAPPGPQDPPAYGRQRGKDAHAALSSPLAWVQMFLTMLDTYLADLDRVASGSSSLWLNEHGSMVEALPYVVLVWDEWNEWT